MLYSTSSILEVKMARHDKQVNFRMAHENIEGLKKHSTENRRSITAQLNLIVEEWLKQQEEKRNATRTA